MGDDNTPVMKKLTVSVPDELDDRLREFVKSEYEDMKGALSIVVKQAIEEFLDKQRDK